MIRALGRLPMRIRPLRRHEYIVRDPVDIHLFIQRRSRLTRIKSPPVCVWSIRFFRLVAVGTLAEFAIAIQNLSWLFELAASPWVSFYHQRATQQKTPRQTRYRLPKHRHCRYLSTAVLASPSRLPRYYDAENTHFLVAKQNLLAMRHATKGTRQLLRRAGWNTVVIW